MENLNRNPLEVENEKLQALNDRLSNECMDLRNRLQFLEGIYNNKQCHLQEMQNRCLLLEGMVRAFEYVKSDGAIPISKEV